MVEFCKPAQADDLRALFDLGNSFALHGLVLTLVGRQQEAEVLHHRALEIRKRRVAKLEQIANTPEDRIRLSTAYTYLAGDQASRLKDFDGAANNLQRAVQIAEGVLAENSESQSAVSAVGTAACELGFVLKGAGDSPGALEAFRKSLKFARIFNARSPSGYSIRKEYDSLMEIAESLYELGKPDEALASLRESFDVRRKHTERDKDNLRAYGGHAYLLNAGGKLLTRMKRWDEALAAFREAEQSHLKVLAGEPNQITNRRNLATLYLTLGDFHTGLGVCSFEQARQYDAISESYKYCPPDMKATATGRVDLHLARTYYQKAADILSKLKAENRFEQDDSRNLALVQGKRQALAGSRLTHGSAR